MSDTLELADETKAPPTRLIRLEPRGLAPMVDIDHEALVLSDDPRREQRWGWIIAFVFFGLIVGFSLFARMDAAVFAQGSIAVSGNRQVVQHQNGGIVSALHVREGQRVTAGDVLVELAPADVGASVASSQSQIIGLQARRARLMAESVGAASIVVPAEFAALDPKAKLEADHAMLMQRSELDARRTSLVRQKAVLNQRASQLTQQIEGFRGQVSATEDQKRLIGEELAGVRSLAERGFASKNQVRALERSEAGLTGQRANLASGAASAQEQIGEMRMQSLGLDSQHAEQVAQELREVELTLSDLLPKYVAMRDRLAGTSIRAPATGQVVGLNVFTVGGVIAPGQSVMEIVPDAAPLVIEAQISPVDADDIQVGQASEIRLVALRDQNVPTLKGQVTRVSADRLVDPKSGAAYFTAEVTIPPSEFARISSLKSVQSRLRAGLPVEVLIPLRKRTAFEYMIEPLSRVFWRSFREH